MKDAKQRLKQKTVVLENECWQMTSSLNRLGYASFWYNGSPRPAHRISYELFIGTIPQGMHVLHKCDNPSCVNPEHLFIGTHSDNMIDKKAKGRVVSHYGEDHWSRSKPESVRRGSRHPNSILTDSDVLFIRQSTEQTSVLCKKFGVERSTIKKIRSGASWKHL